MKKKFVFIPLALLCAVVAGVYLLSKPSPTGAPGWTPGTTHRYRIDWIQKQASRFLSGNDPATGKLELKAELSLSATDRAPGSAVLLTLERVEQFEAQVLEQALPGEALEGGSVLVELADDGRVSNLRFSESDPALLRFVLEGLAAELFPPRPSEDQLEFDEALRMGTAKSVVRWTDAGRSFERQRVEFTELRLSPNAPAKIEVESHADFVLASDGALESVALNERVSAWDAKGQVDARLLHTLDLKPIGSRKSVPLVFADKTVSRTPGVHHDEIDVKRALLEARAGDWDTAKILETLASVEDSDQFPDHHRFVWQATGYLELHPEACAELVGAFVEARSEDMGAQIVDLLLGAGHAEAQSAMRAILDLDEARQNPDVYHQLYQRLGMVPEPTPESIAWLLESRESALAGDDSELLRVQGFTLGAVARGVRKSDPEQANALGDLLLDDLENAASNDDAAVALRALGNSGDPRAVDAVTDRFQSEDPSVRAAAAIALRLVPTEEATQLLIGSLESERSRAAQSAALDALRHRELGESDWGTVRTLVVSGQLQPAAARQLMALVLGSDDRSPAVIQTLQAVTMNPNISASHRAKARSMLNQLAL